MVNYSYIKIINVYYSNKPHINTQMHRNNEIKLISNGSLKILHTFLQMILRWNITFCEKYLLGSVL